MCIMSCVEEIGIIIYVCNIYFSLQEDDDGKRMQIIVRHIVSNCICIFPSGVCMPHIFVYIIFLYALEFLCVTTFVLALLYKGTGEDGQAANKK